MLIVAGGMNAIFPVEDVSALTVEQIRRIPCHILNARLSEADKRAVAYRIVDWFHERGFPYYVICPDDANDILERLFGFDVQGIELSNDELEQNMLGLNLANGFHPQMWSTPCNGQKTPMDVFRHRELFADAIVKRLGLSDTPLADFNIRKSLKVFSGVQSVSNFRPTIAKYIYRTLGAQNVLDPCMGYSGRLLGAWCAGVISYHGIDPCGETYRHGVAAAEYLEQATQHINTYRMFPYAIPVVTMSNVPFEEFETDKTFDVIFTSPPYFDTERYSEEPTQSYLRYPTYSLWEHGFLKPLIAKSYDLLVPRGYLALNVAGTRLVESTLGIARSVFGKPMMVKQMRLSKIMGNGRKAEQSHKLEPIFIWRKP